MTPYKKYKDSGVKWLGKIPEHWEVRRLKFRNKIIMGQSPNSEDVNNEQKGIPFLQGNAEFTQLYPIAKNWCKSPPKIALHNDILLSVRAPVGAINIANLPYGIGRGLSAIRAKKDHTKFLFYLFLTLKEELTSFSTGSTFLAISIDKLKNIIIPKIPLPEQRQIASYLDRQTAKIDKFIRNKKKLVELMKEKKQAIINQAVTKGLNPNVKMKDSGVKWLGEIPEHWEVRRLKSCINGHLKYGANESGGDLQKDDPRYIRITDFDKSGKLRDDTFCSLKSELAQVYLLKEGDILFARSGATVGKTFQFKNYIGEACFAGYLIKAEPNTKIITSDFLFLYTNSGVYEQWKGFIFNKATIENISADKYNVLLVIIPPIKEQRKIVNYLDRQTAKIDKTIKIAEKEIELIEEYRTRLISDVVTGKIDVRGIKIEEEEEI